MKTTFIILLAAICAAAQTPSEPPSLIRVVRSPLQQYSQAYFNVHAPVTVLGMTPISGPSETWLIEAHDSFSTIEEVDRALSTLTADRQTPNEITSDDVLPPSRTLIALYRPGLSYRPEEALRALPKAHYLQVSIFRNRSGDMAALTELLRSRAAGLDSINLDRPDIAYEVISGAPFGTYFLVAPLASLKTLDDTLAALIGRGEGPRRPAQHVEISREHLLFRVEPRMSHVPDDFASVDPQFWNGKPK